MPDSFTKFKEEEPKTSLDANAGSTDDEEDGDDIVYTIDQIYILQESGDTVFFEVDDITNFAVGDTVNVSDDVLGLSTIDDVGTIKGIYDVSESTDVTRYILVVKLDGLAVIGASTYIANGNFIDNCVSGYGQCAPGSAGAGIVDSEVVFHIPSTAVTFGSYNFSKPITVTGTSAGGFSTANMRFTYSFSSSIIGLGVNYNVSGVQTDDRIVSPYGPFLPNSTLKFLGTTDNPALQISVALHSSYYGDELNSEEQGTVNFYASTTIPGTEIDSSEAVAMSYPLPDGQRIAIKVENTSGFAVGEDILSCRLNNLTLCVESSDYVVGKAQIADINTSLKVIYATIEGYNSGTDNSEFPDNYYIIGSSNKTVQVGATQVIFSTSDSSISLSPVWKNNGVIVSEPSNTSYQVDMSTINGLSFSPSTGDLSINNMDLAISEDVEISAINSSTNEVIATYTFSINAVGSPSSIKVVVGNIDYAANPGNPYVLKVAIDDSDSVTLNANVPTDFPTDGIEAEYGLGYVYYTFDTPLTTGAVFTASIPTETEATLAYSPAQFNSGITYTVSGYHPALGGNVAFDTLQVQLKSATSFATFYYPQTYNSGTPANSDKLILEVDDVSAFREGDTISNEGDTNAVITYVSVADSKLFVRLNSTPSQVSAQFKIGDNLDKAATFVTGRTAITDIVHVFDATDVTLSKTPVLYDAQGSVQSLDTVNSETLTWSVTPALPSDLELTTDGSIAVKAPAPTSLTILSETVYTVQAKSAIDETVQIQYKFALVKAPSLASLARYQILRLSSNGTRFYRGTRVSSPPTDGETVAPSGRVLMTIDADEDGTNDSILVEGNGDFSNGMGVDNTPSYFANEATVVPYIFLYVKDASQVATATITSSSGGNAAVVDKNNTNNVIYVKVNSGVFAVGDTITSGANTTTVDNVQNRHYITNVFKLTTNTNNFNIGEQFTGATAGDQGIVIAKDSPYLFVRHVSGSFSQAESIVDADGVTRTISEVVGPNIVLNTSASGGDIQNSSGTRAATVAEDFYEGQPLTCYTSGDGYLTSGFAVAGTDYLNHKVVMQIEDFSSHCLAASDYYIDDISSNPQSSNSGADDANDIESIDSSNLMIGYVGDEFYLNPFVKGQVSSATISPDVLPDGLTFNESTGAITGTPTSPMTGQAFTVTFRSSDGQEISYDFDMVIYNQFEVSQLTDSASSFLMHKEGRGYAASYCRVISPQVIDDISDNRYNKDIYGFNDVLCRLEAGEGDLYNNGIDYQITAGSGMCEYVEYTPFAYRPFMAGQTNRTIVKYDPFADVGSCNGVASGTGQAVIRGNAVTAGYISGDGGDGICHGGDTTGICGGQATPTRTFTNDYCQGGDCNFDALTTELCLYDYSQYDSDWPNLDDGEITVHTVSCEYSEVDGGGGNVDTECDCSYTESIISCGGNPDLNMDGAKTSWSGSDSAKSIVFNSSAGLSRTESVESPISLNRNNKYLANYIALDDFGGVNGCYANNYHMEEYASSGSLSTNRSDWEGYSMTTDPLGTTSESIPLSKFYTFKCLDAAYNPKATITVQVRDWNNEFSPEDAEVEQLSSSNKMESTPATVSTEQIIDLDAFWHWLGSATIAPDYGTCGNEVNSTSANLGNIALTAGVNIASISGIVSGEQFPRGSVIFVPSTGDYYVVARQVNAGDTQIHLAQPPQHDLASTPFQLVRKTAFPLLPQ